MTIEQRKKREETFRLRARLCEYMGQRRELERYPLANEEAIRSLTVDIILTERQLGEVGTAAKNEKFYSLFKRAIERKKHNAVR